MKLAKVLWSSGSLFINVTILIYIILSGRAPLDYEARHAFINENWNIYGTLWKVEFLLMTMIAVGAIYFTAKSKKISWSILSTGQILLLVTYPLMLGGFRNTPFELAEMVNEIATVVFLFGNLVFFSGLFLLYLNDEILKKVLKYIAVALSGIAATIFLITFAELISWKQAMIAGPLVNLLYLINAYYGLRIKFSSIE
ncbi:hypothetical protein SAMN05444280_12721 [Tangfeifania diversioriginum]|uniref:DUF998 domain-containing protein n=1 Tax=Tangfeifania diversioriginum TaxID=1168035 RepID=A0A1M6LK26_9BACT|nr:hypothetical protein [Tangfeifania diversioriginum]SHJ71554.1 hypothetical protein SAMN05444280_12721 [Tangfeifania diversioriginum]